VKRLNAVVRLTFCLATMFAMVSLSQAESGDKRLTKTQQKSSANRDIRIMDQNGNPAVSGVPSSTGQIVDVSVGPGFVFVPDTVNISAGDTVRWTWAGNGHSVTSGDPCTVDGQFCSPDDMNCDQGILSGTGTVYEHTFDQAGTYNYFCFAHCNFGMTGVVNVAAGPTPTPTPTPTATPTATAIPSATPTATPIATPSATPSVTPTPTPTATPTVSPTPGGRPRPTPRSRPTPHPRPTL
jgi:plastocyanin